MESLESLTFRGEGVTLAADAAGPADAPPILFLHGSGQARRSWRKAVIEAVRRGYRAISLDLRGHGDSEWSPDGVYSHELFFADIRNVVAQVGGSPVLVGTSTGGLMSMAVASEPESRVRAAVLIDISPTPSEEGVAGIRAFMGSARDGFASLEDAADAVAAYLPQRARPKSTEGLARNLRLRGGRYYWHWDPAFFFQMAGAPGHVDRAVGCMKRAAETLAVPTLLVRGGSSSVVSPEGAQAFLDLVPHAEYADIAGAHHMVAGDANDAFNEAVFAFLERLEQRP